MSEIIPMDPEINRYIDGAAQEAAEMADLVEEAKRRGAMPASPTAEKAEQRGIQLIRDEVKEQEAEIKQAQDQE